MTSVTQFFQQSELALASYAKNLFPGISGDLYQTALEDGGQGFAPSQAQQFALTWRVLDQYTDSTGLSATIFEEVSSGKRTLAIRGTQAEAGDIVSDVLLAAGVSARLNPQFDALQAKLDNEWLAEGGLLRGQPFTVSGHSLGGYLAAAVKAQYSAQVTSVYLYNAPGSGGLIGNIAGLVAGVFSQTVPGADGVWNIKASEGASIIGGLGLQGSAAIPIQIEQAPGLSWCDLLAWEFDLEGTTQPAHKSRRWQDGAAASGTINDSAWRLAA